VNFVVKFVRYCRREKISELEHVGTARNRSALVSGDIGCGIPNNSNPP